jgi:hypothetical protein
MFNYNDWHPLCVSVELNVIDKHGTNEKFPDNCKIHYFCSNERSQNKEKTCSLLSNKFESTVMATASPVRNN